MKKEDFSFENVLDFLSSFDNWEESEYLYEKVNTFFMKAFDSRPMVIFSLPKDLKVIPKKIRFVWNKDAFSEDEKELVTQRVSQRTEDQKDILIEDTFQGYYFDIFLFGEDESQRLYACLRVEKRISNQELFYKIVLFMKNVHSQNQKWKNLYKQNSLIHIDDVTGLYNQRKLYKDLQILIRRYERSGETFALLFIDIDHFKNVNDNYGHLVGTKILSDMGEVLRRVMRDTDLMYRYGGDEFVIIIPDASVNDARMIGERILRAVKEEHFRVKDSEDIYRISISVGIASFPVDAKTGKEILELADKMMYKAKNRGRGCVCMAVDFYKDS